jgi:NRPS condensation-like uncharacterized protein
MRDERVGASSTGEFPRRPLGLAECMFWQLDRVACGNFVAYVELEGSVAEGDLVRGLAALCEAHPLLRARIVEDEALGRPCFEWAGASPPELRRVEPGAEGALGHWLRELDAPFDVGRAPLFRAHWAAEGGRAWLGLTFHHAIADGRSSARVLTEWVRFIDAGVAPGPTPPPSAQESFYRPQAFGMVDKASHLRAVMVDIGARLRLVPPGNVVPGLCERRPPSREVGHRACELSAGQTEALVRACRRRGVTVHGALGAAYLRALHAEFLEPGRPAVFSLGSPVDLRTARRSPADADDLAVRLAGVVSRLRVTNEEDFWQLAGAVTSDVREQADAGNAHLLHELVYAQTPPGLSRESAVALFDGMARFPWTSVLTNVGRLDAPGLERLAVRRLGFLGAPAPSQALLMAVSTWDGLLLVHALYDRQNLAPARAESLLRRFEAGLLAAADEGRASEA